MDNFITEVVMQFSKFQLCYNIVVLLVCFLVVHNLKVDMGSNMCEDTEVKVRFSI